MKQSKQEFEEGIESFNAIIPEKKKKTDKQEEVDSKKPQVKGSKPEQKVEQLVVEEVFAIENRPTLLAK